MTFCKHRSDGLGINCDRCGSWRRGAEPPDCPPYITRYEPDGARLPQITSRQQNIALRVAYFAKLEAEINAANEALA